MHRNITQSETKKITKMCFEKYLLTCLKAQVVQVNINLLKYKKINKFQ